MPDRPVRRRPSNPTDSLLERLRDRISATKHALQRSDLKSGSRSAASKDSLDFRALHSTYRRLARDHRLYRERSGEPLSGELKAAAKAFKQEPSVFSLVPVAGFLDDLDLLKW